MKILPGDSRKKSGDDTPPKRLYSRLFFSPSENFVTLQGSVKTMGGSPIFCLWRTI
jgi:hypothetical protein